MSAVRAAFAHVYVHVPFCGRRCSYCDFAIAVRKDVPVRAFNDAIMAELVTRSISVQPSIKTVYLGGGTPSKLGGAGVDGLLAGLRERLLGPDLSTFPHGTEVTIEANPEDVNPEAARAWVAAGVNRVSLGAQTFDESVLTWMHRTHGPAAVSDAVHILRDAGLDNISLDLIFALPANQSRDWDRDLELALELEPQHVSLYGLTVEPHTPLGRWRDRGQVEEAPEERYEGEFLAAHAAMTKAGFEHYEVSNFARAGMRSRHNSSYWSGASYLGVGPAAHGFDGRERRWNRGALTTWEAALRAGDDPVEGKETIGESEAAAESVYLGLRTTSGLDIRENELKTVTKWIDEGWGEMTARRLVLSPSGWLRLDAIAASLTALRSHS